MILAAALLLQAAAELPCRWEEHGGGTTTVHFGPERRCAAWAEPRRRSGVWIYGFEDSQFVEGATTLAEAERAHRSDRGGNLDTWLDYDDQSGMRPGCRPILGQAYLVEFDGLDAVSRSKPASGNVPQVFGGFGHMGMFRHAVLIDHLRSMILLGPLSGAQVRPAGPPPTCD